MPRKRERDAPRVVYRTARCGLRVTRRQRERVFGLLRSAGDVWCCVLELAAWRRQRQDPPLAGYRELCRELAASGPGTFGELDSTGARSVLRRYSDAWFATAKRRKQGDNSARYPRRRRALVPVRWHAGTFRLDGRVLAIPIARGCPPLTIRRDRPGHHPPLRRRRAGRAGAAGVRAGDPGRMPAAPARPQGPHPRRRRPRPKPGQRGSRRWRKHRRTERKTQARHARRVRQAQHEAAKAVIGWAVEHRVGTLAVGDPRGVLQLKAGRRHAQRTRDWRVGHLIRALSDKAEAAGITVRLADERGTSSTCPRCARRLPKPAGRNFSCPHCGQQGHRDLVAAASIAARAPGGGIIPAVPHGPGITHRRAGAHLPGVHRARRDPRRRPPSRPAPRRHLAGTGPPRIPPPGNGNSTGSRSHQREEPATTPGQPRRTYGQVH
jgi:IS605 OrfB family transposase